MNSYPKLFLKSKKDQPLRRFHPWVFSGAIKSVEGHPENGEVVAIHANKGGFLGLAHYSEGTTIAARVISFEETDINDEFWKEKIRNAVNLRKNLGYIGNKNTNIFRLVHAEGDHLPGLIIDFYNGVAVMQCHSLGMYKHRELISSALQSELGNHLIAVYNKSAEFMLKNHGMEEENGYLFGSCQTPHKALENGNTFEIDWITGQKTGFFIDQRDNRDLLGHYSEGKKVLNTFSYSGGFSVYALQRKASLVHSLDSSKKALELADANVKVNNLDEAKHKSIASDTLDYLKEMDEDYDIIILDPPAYAKHQRVRHKAVQGYKRLNSYAIKHIKPGGLIFTFSCSQAVDKTLFTNTITAAAIAEGRKVRILHQRHQPPDHPVNVYHPESEYLKGLVIQVD